MRIVDLRSDTVTGPTSAMRTAMYHAEVGDDVYGEDPTVRKLEELAAEMAGKESALFVASGTMGNQIAVMTHTQRGDEIICERDSHIYYYEVGGLAYLAGVQARTIEGEHGLLRAGAVEASIRGEDLHQPRTTLICLENTHNRAGGTCYTVDALSSIYDVARHHGIPVHTDGARIFNAAVAQNVPISQLTQYTDTVNICLSKGLCAPVGSVLLGSEIFIQKARRMRKMIGGGMRQAGVVAAAGIVALTSMTERLSEDHANAKVLAEAIAQLGIDIDLTTVQTNIVLFDVRSLGETAELVACKLEAFGVKCSQFGEYKIRFVTHYGIDREDIDYVISALAEAVKG